MLYNLLKPIIWQINPEIAHDIVIKLLKNNIVNLFLKSNHSKIDDSKDLTLIENQSYSDMKVIKNLNNSFFR